MKNMLQSVPNRAILSALMWEAARTQVSTVECNAHYVLAYHNLNFGSCSWDDIECAVLSEYGYQVAYECLEELATHAAANFAPRTVVEAIEGMQGWLKAKYDGLGC